MEEAKEYMRKDISDDLPPLYCFSNESKLNGAAYIMNEEIQKMVSEKLGGDYYILPSSVHEVLVISKDIDIPLQNIEQMVQHVNLSCVSAEEVLSDHVYHV